MRQFFDADAATGNGKDKKNLLRKNQIDPLEIIIKHNNEKKEEIFNKFDLMTTFRNASNPKKKMTKILQTMQEDMNLNRKRKYEEKNTRERAKLQ